MKKVLFLLISLFSINVYSQSVPDYLKDATITVKLTNGKSYEFSANEWMVVRRNGKPVNQAVAVVKDKAPKKNRIVLQGGLGPRGLKSSRSGDVVTVKERTRSVFGLSIGRLITDDVSVMGTVLTNDTYTLGVGLDY